MLAFKGEAWGNDGFYTGTFLNAVCFLCWCCKWMLWRRLKFLILTLSAWMYGRH